MPPTTPGHSTDTASQSHQVLDPRTMGRPVHLVGRFTQQLRDALTQLFTVQLNRRYRARFEIADVGLAAMTSSAGQQRWRVYTIGGAGRIGFAIDRAVLLCVLGYRYGAHAGKPASQAGDPPADLTEESPAAPSTEPETAGEERLAAMLGQQLVSMLTECIRTLDPNDTEPASAITLATTATALPMHTGWTLRADVVESSHEIEGAIWFRLDQSWVTRLLQGLALSRKRAGSTSVAPDAALEPLPHRLQLTLVARLLEKQVSLGTLLDTRPGDVIPVSFSACDVLIGESRLFTAGITEHKGKLCLTSFEDVE